MLLVVAAAVMFAGGRVAAGVDAVAGSHPARGGVATPPHARLAAAAGGSLDRRRALPDRDGGPLAAAPHEGRRLQRRTHDARPRRHPPPTGGPGRRHRDGGRCAEPCSARWRGPSSALAGTRLPAIVPVWFALLGLMLGAITPRLVLRAEAAKARKDFRHALGAYLDVLVLLLAANEGPEGAMETAARAGNGPAFMELRRATVQARLSGDPIWDALDELGRRINVPEVCEVAAAGGLAGERGAAVRKSLVAKARSLRTTSLAASESDARSRSQAMFAPIVLMGFGFILFLLYPLVSNIQLGP